MPSTLTSLEHPLVKHLVKLREKRSYREKMQTALITGKKMVQELASFSLQNLLVEEGFPTPPIPTAKVFFVKKALLKKITGLENPEPLAAEIPLPPPLPLPKAVDKNSLFLLLDGIADPGNVGTLLRTTLALGWKGAFLTETTADPFNEKALRAAKGASFRLPLWQISQKELQAFIQEHTLPVYIADSRGEPLEKTSLHFPLLLVLGNESRGALSFKNTPYPVISIPLQKEVESLNVSAAGAILMYGVKSRLCPTKTP